MYNPFVEGATETSDEELAARAQSGDRAALEQLVIRHQPWIFNLVVRMIWSVDDAEDLTQDILVKMIKGLHSFHGDSRFRTWLYRVALNQVFTFKNQRVGEPVYTYDSFAQDLDQTPDGDLRTTDDAEKRLLIEEAKIICTMAMLLCLDGRQRAAYILGEIFAVTDSVGAEVLEVSPANFRQILSRARRDLYSFLQGKCGLINQANPCRCARKTQGFIDAGVMRADRVQFAEGHKRRIRDVAPSRLHELEETADRLHGELFRDHPFLDARLQSDLVRRALDEVSGSV